MDYYTANNNIRASMTPIPYWLTRDQSDLLTGEMEDFIRSEYQKTNFIKEFASQNLSRQKALRILRFKAEDLIEN